MFTDLTFAASVVSWVGDQLFEALPSICKQFRNSLFTILPKSTEGIKFNEPTKLLRVWQFIVWAAKIHDSVDLD